jgi:ribosomal-protein-alanine N-acetyltransferase
VGDGVSGTAPVAIGNHVALRSLSVEDATEEYLGWMRDREVTQYLESRYADHSIESIREFIELHRNRVDTLLVAIVERETGRHVGNVKVGPLSPHHGTADLGLLIGDRSVWGRGYGREAISLATELAFERLGARKLTASCYSGNSGSAAAFRRAGWIEEGARPAQYLDDNGDVHDQLMFGTFPTRS